MHAIGIENITAERGDEIRLLHNLKLGAYGGSLFCHGIFTNFFHMADPWTHVGQQRGQSSDIFEQPHSGYYYTLLAQDDREEEDVLPHHFVILSTCEHL